MRPTWPHCRSPVAPVKTLVDRGGLTEVDIRSLHFVIAPRSGHAVQHGALRQDTQPRWTPWTPTPVREHACLVSDMIAAGLRARGA